MGTSDLTLDTVTTVVDAIPRLPAPPARLDRISLFLDLDGVLAEFADTPEGVVPETRRTAVLTALAPNAAALSIKVCRRASGLVANFLATPS